jgi:membrane-associated phospholipid phosphatase
MHFKKPAIIFLLIIWVVHCTAQNWDIDIAKGINPSYPTSGYWKATSTSAYVLGAGVPVGLLFAGLVTNDPKLKHSSLEIITAVAVELIVSETMKYSFNRLRPAEKYPTEIFPYHSIHGKSFPSGHSSLAFATAASVAIQYRKWYIVVPAFAWASSVSYSRVYLGVHYPSDVLAGAAVGIGSAYLAHWFNRRFFGTRRPSR